MSYLNSEKMYLYVKSPINIGGQELKVTRFEFIIKSPYLYTISEEKLSKFLQEKELIHQYISEVGDKLNKFVLSDFFRSYKISLDEAISLSNRRIKILENAANIQEFRPFIRDGFGNVYLPGTSIKGVIRTAIAYCFYKKLKEDEPQNFAQIEKKISDDIEKLRGKNRLYPSDKELFKDLNKKLFENYSLLDKKNVPNTDWLKMLHVSDAYPVNGAVETCLIPVKVLKKENNWYYKKENNNTDTTIWVEAIKENTIFEFEIVWDNWLLDEFKRKNVINLPKNIGEIKSCIEIWSKDIIEFEKKFLLTHKLSSWYSDYKEQNFRIGFGSGMISVTIAMLLEEKLRKKIRNFAGLNRGDSVAPKSRRVAFSNDTPYPLGWATLTTDKPPVLSEATIKEIVTPKQTSSIIDKIQETWNNATFSWSPNNQTLKAEKDGKKAEIKLGSDKSIVPEIYHKKLFSDKKPVKANVVVEREGNVFKIIHIEQPMFT